MKKENFTKQEKLLLKRLQGDIPLSATPFADLAREVGMNETEVLSLLQKWQELGIIKRLGALLRHQKSGFTINAMVVWELPPERITEAGRLLAEQEEVSHCYERTPAFQGRFNLFTMIHLKATSKASAHTNAATATLTTPTAPAIFDDSALLEAHIATLAQKIGAWDYQILKSEKELKKISREYF